MQDKSEKPDLFQSLGNPGASDRLNLSPRQNRIPKAAPGTLRGDKGGKDPEEGKKSRNAAGTSGKSIEKGLQNASSHDSDSFFRLYNQEIKINQDEIPIILAELTDAAYNFIQREQYEKALILLQKTEGVLDCVSLADCSRDKFVTFITYNNMSMCFQKLNMLEECLTYLKESIKIVKSETFLKGSCIALRMKKLRHECKLKLQLCAILSQTQSHTEAQNNAFSAVKLCHQLFKDLEELCAIYADKITYRENLLAAQEQSDLDDEEREQYVAMILDSSPAKEIPKNFLEKSISLIERSSLKLMPVVREVRKRMAGEAYVKDKIPVKKDQLKVEKEGEKSEESDKALRGKAGTPASPDEDDDDEPADMRSVLGFLNQQEWIGSLNIGNIMQIQAYQMKDFMNLNRDEAELNRDAFLEKLSVLTVSYFCMSTEMRFLLQLRGSLMKPAMKKEKEYESEYWHAKALELACTFLPSECPLLNHILLSYQKHHDPAKQPIREDEETSDILSILRPIKGIDQSKYQPIVRQLPITVKVSLSPNSIGVTHGLRTLLQTEERALVARVLKNHLPSASQAESKPPRPERSTEVPVVVSQAMVLAENPNLIEAVMSTHEKELASVHSSNKSDLKGVSSPPDYRDESPASSLHPSEDEKAGELPAIDHSKKSRDQNAAGLNVSAISKQGNAYHLRSSSIEGLERQILDVSESPLPGDAGSPTLHNMEKMTNVDWLPDNLKQQMKEAVNAARKLRDSSLDDEKAEESQGGLPQVDSILMDNDQLDTKLYDNIISKLLEDPRIDKKTLLHRFISKMEVDSKDEANRMNEEIASLKERSDNIQQRQNISQQVPHSSASGSMMLPPHSAGSMSQVSITKEEKKRNKNQACASVQQASRLKNQILEEVPLSEGEKRRQKIEDKQRKTEQTGILPQTRIRKRTQKSSQGDKMAEKSVNTSKISNLSKTTGQKTLKQESRLSNLRPASKQLKQRPSSRLVKEGKVQGSKTRKIISYLERDQLLDGQSFDNDSADAPRKKPFKQQEQANFYADEQEEMLHVDDIELQEKSETRSRIESQSILTIGGDGQGEQVSRIDMLRSDSAEKETDERRLTKQEELAQQLSDSHKKSSSKTRPSSGITNFTRSSSNMKRRRRQAATTLVQGLSHGINQTSIANQYKRQRVDNPSRSSSSQRKSKGGGSQNMRQSAKRSLKRTSAPITNSNSTAAVPVQKFLEEQNNLAMSNVDKENFSLIANTRGAMQTHSQQVLPPKGRPVQKPANFRQKSTIMPAGQQTSVFDSNQHNLSQQLAPSQKLLVNTSQKRLRKLLGSKNSKLIDNQAMARAQSGAAATGYKTAQPRVHTLKQKGSNYNSVTQHVANQLSQTKPRVNHSSSQALGKNQQLYAQLSHHLQMSNNQRGRSRKRKRVLTTAQNINSGVNPVKMQTRAPILARARSGGSYSHSTGRRTASQGSSISRSTRVFAGSNSTSNKKRHRSSESQSRSNPRNKSSRSDHLRYSSKRRSGNKTVQESKAHQLEFKKAGGLFNVVTNQQEHQSSLCDLQRQVLANQKILLQEISSQQQLHRMNRSNSSERKKRQRSYLIPQQQKSQPQSNQHLKQSLDILLRQAQPHNRAKSNKTGSMKLKVEPKQKNQDKEDPRVFMSKSLHFMQSLAKKQQLVNQSQLLQRKPSETLYHTRKQQIDEDSVKRKTSGGRRSNSHERKTNKSQGRSQSPPQPNMARIPKKKQYARLHTSSQAQIFRDDGLEPSAAIAMQGQLIASGGQHLGSTSNDNIPYNRMMHRQHATQGHVQSQSVIQRPPPHEDFEPQSMGEFSQEDFEYMRAQVIQQAAQRPKQPQQQTVTREMHKQRQLASQQVKMLAQQQRDQSGFDDDDLEESPLREMLEHQQEQLHFQQQQQQELLQQQKLYMR